MKMINHHSWAALVVVCSLLLVVVASEAATLVRQPLNIAEIQGRWNLISETSRGRSIPWKSFSLEIKGDHCTMTRISQLQEMRLVLDTTHVATTIDRIVAKGTKDERKYSGVCEVSATRLIICGFLRNDRNAADRPTSLESTPGSGINRTEWQRRGPIPGEGSSISQRIEGEWVLVKSIFDGVHRTPNVKEETIWNIKGGVINGEGKFTEELNLSLQKGSAKADLLRISDSQNFPAIIDFEPFSQELKIAENPPGDENYPTDFVSTPAKLASIYVFKRSLPNSP